MKIGTIALLALGVVIALPTLKMDPVTDFASQGNGPVFAGSLFPFVFITIACGASPASTRSSPAVRRRR